MFLLGGAVTVAVTVTVLTVAGVAEVCTSSSDSSGISSRSDI